MLLGVLLCAHFVHLRLLLGPFSPPSRVLQPLAISRERVSPAREEPNDRANTLRNSSDLASRPASVVLYELVICVAVQGGDEPVGA